MDLVIAGTIDHLAGHGTVRLLPLRLEEIADRIGPRMRDPDGAWVVTLLPPEDDLAAVNPYDVLAYVRQTYVKARTDDDDIDIAGLVLAASRPGMTLRDMSNEGYSEFVYWCGVDNQSG